MNRSIVNESGRQESGRQESGTAEPGTERSGAERRSGGRAGGSALIDWPIPEPALPAAVHPVLADAARAASAAYGAARRRHTRAELGTEVAMGADGTPTMLLDRLVEEAVADVAHRHGVNLLSEEAGFVDNSSAVTMVVDPVDGSSNAATGVPLSCFAGVLAIDGVGTEAVTTWLDTGRAWHAVAGTPTPFRTTGRTSLTGAEVCLLRPRPETVRTWQRVALRAGRVRVLSTTCLEAVLVAEGSIDAFADVGAGVHRIMDLAAAMVIVPAAGGVVVDALGRPLELNPDLSLRWSGIVAATEELAGELIDEIGAADTTD
ncbi:myo-inositol-1(or 4)-monophosphatase [Actinoalloteichus hoggarensis]|uniref:inositol monophosphatase family protein n=1 Tax=Actinoalloteichus hoggarensis TaxID=1470176 RepID=UPI0017E0C27F|nr:inositol monophosphatase family protein [Actinoalloteichus hoggarensis]MBB5924165.1 myo-inositol-1(or 4)-monophosphatase [Actinoalloteichus hoggarensis]